MKDKLLLILMVSLAGCSLQARLSENASQRDTHSTQPTFLSKESESSQSVVYGWQIVHGKNALTALEMKELAKDGWQFVSMYDPPRLSSRVGAADRSDLSRPFDDLDDFTPSKEAFVIYVPENYSDDVAHGLWFSFYFTPPAWHTAEL